LADNDDKAQPAPKRALVPPPRWKKQSVQPGTSFAIIGSAAEQAEQVAWEARLQKLVDEVLEDNPGADPATVRAMLAGRTGS
jgi:hypothetical protein